VTSKSDLRKALRAARKEHVAAQSDAIRALLFNRPPAPLLEKIGSEAVIGLYHANSVEAPAGGYARFFHEAGHRIALPAFTAPDAPMIFREHSDPHSEGDLEKGAFGMLQPASDAAEVAPDVLFIPLVGFTTALERLGQGGGHYDRWLAANPGRMVIGLAWDVQLVRELPLEPHDMPLDAIVTPTRIYGIG
jgi:5-formyltetrahydrofolate cyclo-ligase